MTSFNADTDGAEVIKHLASHAKGKTFVITGASENGIGAELAKILASAEPKRVILVSRTESKVIPVIEEIRKTNPNVSVTFVHIDLLDNSSVRKAAEHIKAVTDTIDGLVNNAGVMAVNSYVPSKNGCESQFAANYLGHYLLTKLLINEILTAGRKATVVNVSSLGYQLAEIDLKDPNFENGKTYNPWRAYGAAKTAQILFSFTLGKRLQKQGVAVFAVHPGVVMESKLHTNSNVTQELFMDAYKLAIERNDGKPLPPQTTKTLQQGAACVLVALLDPSLRNSSPAFLVENQIAEAKEYATDAANGDALWNLSEKLIGEKFEL